MIFYCKNKDNVMNSINIYLTLIGRNLFQKLYLFNKLVIETVLNHKVHVRTTYKIVDRYKRLCLYN